MTESENLKLALELIKINKISDAIELLKGSKYIYTLKLLGLLFCVSGEFEKAYSIFLKLNKKEEKVSEYLFYLEGIIKNEYIPKYNRLIKLIQENKEFKEIEKLFIELEEKFANVDLYNIATLFYLSQNNIKIAYNYYIKLSKLDTSYKNNSEFETFFDNKSLKNKMKINYFLGVCLFGIALFFINKNLKLKEDITLKDKENISLAEKIQIVQAKNKELFEINKNISVDKENIGKEIIIEKIIVKNEELLTNDEIYSLALKRFKQDNYNETLKICEKIIIEQLSEYKAKEILFIKGISYEKLSQKEAALKCYKEFLDKYNKTQYKDYIKIIKQKIINLEKGFKK